MVWTVSNARNLNGSFKDQTIEALEILQSFLLEAGTDKTNLVSVQVVLAQIADRDEFNEIWCEWIGPDPSCWPQRAVFAAALAPGLRIELIATAIRPA